MTDSVPDRHSPLVAVDVGYIDGGRVDGAVESTARTSAIAAAVGFRDWEAAEPETEWTIEQSAVADYVPGSFYLRELPCLLALLKHPAPPDSGSLAPPRLPHVQAVLVDGYVWLDNNRPGLGAHLYRALGEQTPIIGVAKTSFAHAPAVPLHRGASDRPLMITAAGMTPDEAAGRVASMHGAFRIPTLLKRVDQLTRR